MAVESLLPEHTREQVLDMIAFAADGIDLSRVWVTIGFSHTRAGNMWRPPQAYRRAGKAGAEAHVSVLVPWPRQALASRGWESGENANLTPAQNAASGWGPGVRMTTSEEDLVSTLAHEFRHLVQNRDDQAAEWTLWPDEDAREIDAGTVSRAALDRWRADRKRQPVRRGRA
jgi:hypothetical protein